MAQLSGSSEAWLWRQKQVGECLWILLGGGMEGGDYFFKKEHPAVSELNTQILLQLIRLFRRYRLEILPLEFYSLKPQ